MILPNEKDRTIDGRTRELQRATSAVILPFTADPMGEIRQERERGTIHVRSLCEYLNGGAVCGGEGGGRRTTGLAGERREWGRERGERTERTSSLLPSLFHLSSPWIGNNTPTPSLANPDLSTPCKTNPHPDLSGSHPPTPPR